MRAVNFADIRQSLNYAHYMQSLGWQVENIDRCQIFIKRLPLIGSIIKIQRPTTIPFSEIDRFAKKCRALFVRIEPINSVNSKQLTVNSYKLDRSPLLPTKTLQLDLTPSIEAIFSQFKKDCRYEIRKAEKNKFKIVIERAGSVAPERGTKRHIFCTVASGATDLSALSVFVNLWHKNAWTRGFWIPIKKQIKALWEAFGHDAYLVTCHVSPVTYQDSIAGALIVIHDNIAYYFHAASSPEGRKLSAPYLVVWEAIKLAKIKGCKIFDFEGIYDERFPNKSWLGFTHFKKSFGGKEMNYPGPLIKIYNPLLRIVLSLRC